MKFTYLFVSLGLVFVAGCQLPADPTVAFNESDFRNFRGSGSSTLTGHVFLNTYDKVVLGAGDEVDLTPATPYTKERFSFAQAGRAMPAPDPRLDQYVRATVADNNGNFAFRNLPPGEYIVSCAISWEVPSEYMLHATKLKSEMLQTIATMADGEQTKVVLTGSD